MANCVFLSFYQYMHSWTRSLKCTYNRLIFNKYGCSCTTTKKVDFICILNGAADTNFSVTAWRRFIYFVFMLYIEIGHVGLHLSFAYLKKGGGSRGTPPLSFSLRKIQFCTVTENSFRPPTPLHPTIKTIPWDPPLLENWSAWSTDIPTHVDLDLSDTHLF